MRTRLISVFVILLMMSITAVGLQLSFQKDIIIHSSSADSLWIQDTENDFRSGTPSNLDINPTGEIELSKYFGSVSDDFFDESKISYKENVTLSYYGEINPYIILNNTYGGSKDDVASSIIATPDNGYMIAGYTYSYGNGTGTGNSNSNVWLLKLDKDLNEEWNRTFGGNNTDRGYSVLLSSDNNFIIFGVTESFGNNESLLWVIKTDNEGNELWNKTLGPSSNYYNHKIRETSDGGFIILNWKLIKVDKDFNQQWNRSIGGEDIQQTSDGGYIIIDDILMKTDESGDIVWTKTFYPEGHGSAVIQTYDGGYLMSIHHYPLCGNGNVVVEVLKTDPIGHEQWHDAFEYYGDTYINSITTSNDGDLILAGYSGRFYSFSNAFLIKIDLHGKIKWERLIGDYANGAIIDSVIKNGDKGYLLAGSIYDPYHHDLDGLLIKTDINGYKRSKGILVSTDLAEYIGGETFSTFESFKANTSIPENLSIRIQFSQDKDNWYNSIGLQNSYDNLSDGFNSIDLSELNWKYDGFYYRCEFNYGADYGLSLLDIELEYSVLDIEGTFISKVFEGKGNANWKTITWDAHVPSDTKLKFQLRTGNNETDILSNSFIGPDGSPISFYDDSPSNIWPGHKGHKCIQYKGFLNGNVKETPILKKLTISYNLIPHAPAINNLVENKWINYNDLIINWQFRDLDGEQSGFQILIDDSSDFDDIDLEIINESSSNQFWRWNPNSMSLGDGIWFFKIRTKDDGGDWSTYSNYSRLNIDTEPPLDFVLTIDEKVWYSIDQQEIHFGTNDITSGIDHYDVKVDDGLFTKQESPYVLPDLDDGIHYVYIRAYDKVGNYKESSSRVQVDTTLPLVTHDPVSFSQEGESITIKANVTDELSGVDYLFLYYRNLDQRSFFSVKMFRNGNEYSAIIPSSLTTSNIKYFFFVKDGAYPSNQVYYGRYGSSDANDITSFTISILKNKNNENIIDDLKVDEKIDNDNADRPDKENIEDRYNDHENDSKQDNSSLILFFIILGIIISIIWVRILNKYDLLSPYIPPSSSQSAHPYIFSSGVRTGLGHIGEYLPPENTQKTTQKDLERLEYFKPRPKPPEIGAKQLFKSKRAMMNIKCFTCGKPQITKISRISRHNLCSDCKKILK